MVSNLHYSPYFCETWSLEQQRCIYWGFEPELEQNLDRFWLFYVSNFALFTPKIPSSTKVSPHSDPIPIEYNTSSAMKEVCETSRISWTARQEGLEWPPKNLSTKYSEFTARSRSWTHISLSLDLPPTLWPASKSLRTVTPSSSRNPISVMALTVPGVATCFVCDDLFYRARIEV